jgi:hypothetical protein
MRLDRGTKTSKGRQPCVGHAIDWQSQRRYGAPCDHRWTPRSEFRNAALNRHVLGLAEQAGVTAYVLADVTAYVTTHRIPLLLAKTHGPSLLAPLQKQSNGPFCSLDGLSRLIKLISRQATCSNFMT